MADIDEIIGNFAILDDWDDRYRGHWWATPLPMGVTHPLPAALVCRTNAAGHIFSR